MAVYALQFWNCCYWHISWCYGSRRILIRKLDIVKLQELIEDNEAKIEFLEQEREEIDDEIDELDDKSDEDNDDIITGEEDEE